MEKAKQMGQKMPFSENDGDGSEKKMVMMLKMAKNIVGNTTDMTPKMVVKSIEMARNRKWLWRRWKWH